MVIRPFLPIVALLASVIACLATALTSPPRPPLPGEGDAALYRAITTRVQSGQPYYEAAGAELRARRYGLRSPLNWRTPTLTHLAATNLAKPLLLSLSLTTLLLAIHLTKQQGGLTLALLAAVILPSPLLASFSGDTHLFSELWTGTLILLSILLFPKHPVLSTLPAIAALFLRELAGPYVLLLFAYLATYDGRETPGHGKRASVLSSFILLPSSLVFYAAFYLHHVSQVLAHLLPTDPAYPTGYLTLQGLPFLLATARQSTYLLALPLWVTAIYLPLAIFGLFHLPKPIRPLATTTALTYLTLFTIAGKPFNDYWGLLISPLLTLSFLFALPPLTSSCLHVFTRRRPYPFTAPTVSPSTNSLCNQKNNTTTGNTLSTVPAISTPNSP